MIFYLGSCGFATDPDWSGSHQDQYPTASGAWCETTPASVCLVHVPPRARSR